MRLKQLPPWVTPKRVARALILLTSLSLLARYPFDGPMAGRPAEPPGDFAVYVRAWERAQAGQNPYVASDPSPYKYSPGVLALMRFLPSDAGKAWMVYGTISILLMALALAVGSRYRTWKSVGLLLAGLVLAWKGILETLDYGQLELLLFSIATLSAAMIGWVPFLAGLLAGGLPWFKLPWVILGLPVVLYSTSPGQPGKLTPRRTRLAISGYLSAWFVWGAAVPSLVFGSDRALQLSQAWMELLRTQPAELFASDINQSLWTSALRWTRFVSGDSPGLAYGIVGIFGALALALLVARPLRTGARARIEGEPLSWISPWLLFTQMLNPLAWRWGSIFAVGMPLAAEQNAERQAFRKPLVRRVLWAIVIALWLLQLNPVARALGYAHWTGLHGLGSVTCFWLAMLVLAL